MYIPLCSDKFFAVLSRRDAGIRGALSLQRWLRILLSLSRKMARATRSNTGTGSSSSRIEPALLGNVSTNAQKGVPASSQVHRKPFKRSIRVFPREPSWSLLEMSREAIWVAILAAADGHPAGLTDRPCSLHDAFGQLGLPTLIIYYLEFLWIG